MACVCENWNRISKDEYLRTKMKDFTDYYQKQKINVNQEEKVEYGMKYIALGKNILLGVVKLVNCVKSFNAAIYPAGSLVGRNEPNITKKIGIIRVILKLVEFCQYVNMWKKYVLNHFPNCIEAIRNVNQFHNIYVPGLFTATDTGLIGQVYGGLENALGTFFLW